MSSSAISTGFLNIFRDGDASVSLDSLLQYLAALFMKKVFLIFDPLVELDVISSHPDTSYWREETDTQLISTILFRIIKSVFHSE